MKRPMVCALPFLAAGIIFGRYIYPSLGFMPLFLGAAFAAIILLAVKKSKVAALFPLLTVIGFVSVLGSLTDTDSQLREWANTGEYVVVTGKITSVSKTSKGRPKIVVQTDEVTSGGENRETTVNILAYMEEGSNPQAGDTVILSGILNELRFQRNPGGYDEFTYLRARKIQYTMFPETTTYTGKAFVLSALPERVRTRFQSVLYRVMPSSDADVLSAMLLGDKSELSDSVMDAYRGAGVYHILAVSGLHVSIIAVVLNKLLQKLRISRSASGLITLVFLAFYCLMAGASPGTVRAVVMAGVYIIGDVIFRKSDSMNTCAFAAVVLLLYEPLYLWDMGFQYSFTAVAGLIAGGPAMTRLLMRLSGNIKWLARLMDSSFIRKNLPGVLAATVATFPVLTHYYYEFPIISLLSNLIIVPTVSLTVTSGFLVCLVGLFNTGLAKLVAVIPQMLVRLYSSLCKLLANLSFSKIFTGSPGLAAVLLFYVALIIVLWAEGAKTPLSITIPRFAQKSRSRNHDVSAQVSASVTADEKRKHTRQLPNKLLIIIAAASYVVFVAVGAAIPTPLTITVLDVGQGDCMVFSQGGSAFVVDGGGSSLDKLGDDTGVWTLLPYLNYMGIGQLDAAFVSHADSDHTIGIIEAIQAGRVGRLFISDQIDGEAEVLEALLHAAAGSGTEVISITSGDRVIFWDSVTVDCLYPGVDGDGNGNAGSGNDSSLLLKIVAGSARFLLTGDMERYAERTVLGMYSGDELEADILKLAHHGSRTSSSQAFLEAAKPLVAVAGAGFRHGYGHPHITVTNWLDEMDVPLYGTNLCGAILLYPGSGEIKIKTMAGYADERTKRQFKIW